MTVIRTVDEETPLLQTQPKQRTPLPWLQLTIVLFLQLAEPITSQVIFPFAPQLIRDLGITGGDEKKVGYYVGTIESLFFITQAITTVHWSRLSDHIGRKPVILAGLAGLSLSMYCFGLSRTFGGLVLSRALNGALNGNVGVSRTIMGELTDSTNISQAFAYMPLIWSIGATLGPIIGGSLARPAEQFPALFGTNEFLKKYPYFLPCAVPATYTVCTWIVIYLFLKETVEHPIPLKNLFLKSEKQQNPGGTVDSEPAINERDENERPLPFRSLLTYKVIIAAANYASLALLDIAFRALQPLFFATPIELGGLGLPPSTIGLILSAFGILSGCFQIFFFAKINDYLGSKKLFTIGVASAIPLFLSFPIINWIARTEGYTTTLWIAVGLHVILSLMLALCFGAIFIIIRAASPNKASLGATNGFSQAIASVMRAIGPAVTNSMFSLSITNNYLGGNLVYFLAVLMVGVSLFVASTLPSSTTRA